MGAMGTGKIFVPLLNVPPEFAAWQADQPKRSQSAHLPKPTIHMLISLNLGLFYWSTLQIDLISLVQSDKMLLLHPGRMARDSKFKSKKGFFEHMGNSVPTTTEMHKMVHKT